MRQLRDIRVVWTRSDRSAAGGDADWAAALTRWAEGLADVHAHDGTRILKKESDDAERIDGVYRATLRVGDKERDVVIKCRTQRRFGDRFKAAVHMGRADRHRRNAALLESHGIETAAVLAQATARVRGSSTSKTYPVELLVMDYIEGATLLEIMSMIARGDPASPSVKQQHELARAVARQVEQFVDAKLYNRDHKPSNLIVRNALDGWRVVVIDAVAIRPGSNLSMVRMFASLVIEPIGCGCPPRRALMMQVTASTRDLIGGEGSHREEMRPLGRTIVRRLWRIVEMLVAQHRDPRPKTDPLSKLS